MIKQVCTRQGINFTARSGDWLLELEKDGELHRIVGSNFDLNTQAAAMIARDKAAASTLLTLAQVNHVPHVILKSSDSPDLNESLLVSMLRGNDVVVKPLEGYQGRLVTRISNVDGARALIDASGVTRWVVSPFVDISREIRLVVLDGEVRLAYAKIMPVTMNGLKIFNLSRGAKAETLNLSSLDEATVKSALSAVHAIGLRVAAVDMVETSDGQIQVLEVNASFSLMHYAQTNSAAYDETAEFYDQLVTNMFTT